MSVPVTIETKVVAWLARGDTHAVIVDNVLKDFDYRISPNTISAIKKRNADNLEIIKQSLMKVEQANAQSIRDRALRMTNRRLASFEKAEEENERLEKQMLSGEISYKEYNERKKILPSPTITELMSVAKEMFHQARTESGQPSSYVSNPAQAQEKLKELQAVLDENDEITLERIVFAKSESSKTTSVQPSPTSQT